VSDFLKALVALWILVLLGGTLWRLGSYHLIASQQPHLNHLGLAMSQQY
jgi:hypothetical protein